MTKLLSQPLVRVQSGNVFKNIIANQMWIVNAFFKLCIDKVRKSIVE